MSSWTYLTDTQAFPLIELELALVLIVVRVYVFASTLVSSLESLTWFTKHCNMEEFWPDHLALLDDAFNAFDCLHLPFVDLSSITG
jgi:hypothetical protein